MPIENSCLGKISPGVSGWLNPSGTGIGLTSSFIY